MDSKLVVAGTAFLYLSWSCVASAQLPPAENAISDSPESEGLESLEARKLENNKPQRSIVAVPDEKLHLRGDGVFGNRGTRNPHGVGIRGDGELKTPTDWGLGAMGKSSNSQIFSSFPAPKFIYGVNPKSNDWRVPNSKFLAQTPPPVPPGTIEQPRPGLPPPPSTPTETPTPITPLTPPLQTPQVPPAELGAKVKVERIEVLGSTVFSQPELQAAVKEFIGKEATFEDLLAIRSAVTKLYTDNNYTTSGAFLPSQDITTGAIKIQVVEGALERIEIRGLRRLSNSYVRSRIALASGPPVNIRRLEEALQLLQLDPLLSSVQAELTSGTAPGLSVLTLNLREGRQISAALLLENRDSPSVGEIRGTAILSHNNLSGLGDRFSADVGFTAGVKTYGFSYDIPLNARDGTLSLRYGNNSNRIIEQPFTPLNINGNAQTVSIGFRQPISRTPNSEFALSLSADWRQSQTFLLRDIPFSFSEGPINGLSTISALRFSQEWTNRSTNRVLAARSQFNIGLNVLGATVNDSGIDGRFFSWVGQFQYVQSFGAGNILIARIGTQLTPDSLLPLEQFSIGGIDTVRGYRQNQRVADNGIIGSAEVRFPIINKPQSIGVIQLAPFFDVGRVWNNNGETPTPSTLISLGLGLRWQLDPYFSARLDYGIPLNRIGDRGNSLQDSGLFFSIRFQPF